MKKLLAICVFILLNLNAYAQQGAIKINPLSLILRALNIQGEIKVTKNQTFQLGAIYINRDYEPSSFLSFGTSASSITIKEVGFCFTPEYRFYLPIGKSESWKYYIAPYYRLMNLDIKETTEFDDSFFKPISYETNMLRHGGGLLFGIQLREDNVVIDFFVGGQYMVTDISNHINSKGKNDKPYVQQYMYERFLPRFGITFGLSNMK